MKTFGLTGGVGMGKSTAARLLQLRGIQLVDSDELARDIVEPGEPALAEIQQAFGPRVIGPDGHLRRDELAGIVFADEAARRTLEQITHPRIRQRWLQQVESWRAQCLPCAVIVVPLLFETGGDADVDVTVCLACSAATQRQRLLERGWSPEQIQQRIGAQWSTEQKINRADFVVWTEGTIEVLAAQLDRVFPKA